MKLLNWFIFFIVLCFCFVLNIPSLHCWSCGFHSYLIFHINLNWCINMYLFPQSIPDFTGYLVTLATVFTFFLFPLAQGWTGSVRAFWNVFPFLRRKWKCLSLNACAFSFPFYSFTSSRLIPGFLDSESDVNLFLFILFSSQHEIKIDKSFRIFWNVSMHVSKKTLL